MSRATDRLKTDKRAWFGVGVIVLIGIGVLSATSRTKMRDPTDSGSTRPPSSPNA